MPEQPTTGKKPDGDFGRIGSELRDAGGKIGAAALEKAEGLVDSVAESGKKAGLEQLEHVTEAAEQVAKDLQDQAPMIADYVRDAACRIDDMGRALREKTVGDLLTTATDFGKKQPMMFFAGAAVLGFALSRFVRSGIAAAPSGSASPEDRDEVVNKTGINV